MHTPLADTANQLTDEAFMAKQLLNLSVGNQGYDQSS